MEHILFHTYGFYTRLGWLIAERGAGDGITGQATPTYMFAVQNAGARYAQNVLNRKMLPERHRYFN